MISVQTALTYIKQHRPKLPTEHIPLQDAVGRTLAQNLAAELSMPPFPASNMDGYAVSECKSGDYLEIIGESAAGMPFNGTINTGQAIRISTGAMVPEGADRILIQEKAKRNGDQVLIKSSPKPGSHIRSAGSDFEAGDRLFESGHRLKAADVALLAAAGCAGVQVKAKPRLAIFSTGDELRPIGEKIGKGQIHAANAVGLIPLLESWGANVTNLGILPDEADAVGDLLPSLAKFDVIVPIGGASVGKHDHMRPAFSAAGFDLLFETIALRPGKPSWMAVKDNQIVFGLPGNPASSFVCAHLFLRPLLGLKTQCLSARLNGDIEENGPRETYLRARASVQDGHIQVEALEDQESFRLRPQSDANALLRIPPMGGPYRSADIMDVILIDALAAA